MLVISETVLITAVVIVVASITAGLLIDHVTSYDPNIIENYSIRVWDKFEYGDNALVEVRIVYPGTSNIEITGDINMSFNPNVQLPSSCPTGDVCLCADPKRIHNCFIQEPSGSKIRLIYTGVQEIGVTDVSTGDALGFQIKTTGFIISDVVVVQ